MLYTCMYLYPQTFNNIAVENPPETILWMNYRFIAKTLVITTYLETEPIKLHIPCNSVASPSWRFCAIAQKSKDTGSLFQSLLPPNPPMIKRMGIYQYSNPPDSVEKNPTLYCNCMERRLVLVTINLFNYITVFPSHTLYSLVIHKNLIVCGAVQM